MKITTIGIDLAKEVFQIHGVDEHGKVVLRKRLSRGKMAKFFANIVPFGSEPNGTKLSRFSAVFVPMQSHLHFMSWGG
jgi:transposase